MTKTGNKIGLLGVAMIGIGVIVMIYPTADTRVVPVGVSIQALGYVLAVAGALLRPMKWLFVLLLVPFSYWLWLLSLGH